MHEQLSNEQIDHFIQTGFVRIENAFPAQLAREAQDILWRDLPVDRHNPATWNQPVIRLGMYTDPPFVASANTALLHRAFDQLVGAGNWLPCLAMGTFPVRFPSREEPNDTGWHAEASYAGADPGNFFEWRLNVRSKGRGLLMLFLFSDVDHDDAPTRIRIGSHLEVARLLNQKGEEGYGFMELAEKLDTLQNKDETWATGPAGTVYLCHPFLVHAAQAYKGKHPKFMAQPPLLLKRDLDLNGSSAVEQSIRLGIGSAV